ncbi:hypothetical protein [Vibrio sp. YIC-376]
MSVLLPKWRLLESCGYLVCITELDNELHGVSRVDLGYRREANK